MWGRQQLLALAALIGCLSIYGITISLFGRNLTDEDGYTHGYDVAGLWSYASVRPPRTYGAEIAYTFGK